MEGQALGSRRQVWWGLEILRLLKLLGFQVSDTREKGLERKTNAETLGREDQDLCLVEEEERVIRRREPRLVAPSLVLRCICR